VTKLVFLLKLSGHTGPELDFLCRIAASHWQRQIELPKVSLRFLLIQVWLSIRLARYFLVHHTKTRKNIPNEHKINQIAVNISNGHEIYQQCPFQDPPKSTQTGIFGIQIFHLATLLSIPFTAEAHKATTLLGGL
jgi:hypothetical protein